MKVSDLSFMGLSSYSVRSDGVVFHSRKLYPLKPSISKSGYARVNLVIGDEGEKKFLVHRLVALAFIDNPEDKPHVNHIDFNTLNNSSENLEWVTPIENSHHSIDRLARGDNHPASKLSEAQRIYVKMSGLPGVTLAQMFGVSRQLISYYRRQP